MESISNSISVLSQIAIIALVLVGALLVGRILLRWLNNVFLHRLPRPFLGDGPNMEWAVKKRAELEEGKLTIEPSIYEPSEPVSWYLEERGDEPKPEASNDNRDGSEGGNFAVEGLIGEDEESLLMSWLQETGHIDDSWAEKLLEKRESTEER